MRAPYRTHHHRNKNRKIVLRTHARSMVNQHLCMSCFQFGFLFVIRLLLFGLYFFFFSIPLFLFCFCYHNNITHINIILSRNIIRYYLLLLFLLSLFLFYIKIICFAFFGCCCYVCLPACLPVNELLCIFKKYDDGIFMSSTYLANV